jgi:hypothetical protein
VGWGVQTGAQGAKFRLKIEDFRLQIEPPAFSISIPQQIFNLKSSI